MAGTSLHHLIYTLPVEYIRMVKYVLSCDGGGVRGIAAIRFLCHLEKAIGPLHEYFDMVAGTSVGGMIAAKISINHSSMKDLEKAYYNAVTSKMFDKSCLDNVVDTLQLEPKYDGKGKDKVICSYFENKKLGDSTIPLLIPCYDVIKRKPKFFKSWRDSHVMCCDVISATSAAPAYFPSYRIGDQEYIDGGVIINNPSMSAYVEAKKMWPNEEIKVLAIGTGYPNTPFTGTRKWGGIQWITRGLITVLTDQSHVDYQMKELIGSNYFRVDSKLTVEDENLDNYESKNIAALSLLGDHWWDYYKNSLLTWIQK